MGGASQTRVFFGGPGRVFSPFRGRLRRPRAVRRLARVSPGRDGWPAGLWLQGSGQTVGGREGTLTSGGARSWKSARFSAPVLFL